MTTISSDSPAELSGFFTTQPEKIEEPTGAFYLFKDVANVRPWCKKRVDRCDELAIVFKGALANLASDGIVPTAWTDADEVVAALAILLEYA